MEFLGVRVALWRQIRPHQPILSLSYSKQRMSHLLRFILHDDVMAWKHIPHYWPVVHDDVIKWKHFPRYLPFVRGIHRSPVNSPHKGQWRGALMFTLICARINSWVNNREAGDLRRYRPHYDVIVMERNYQSVWFPVTKALMSTFDVFLMLS